MPKKTDIESLVEEEIIHEIQEFEREFKEKTSDPSNFLTIHELERMYGRLLNNTKVFYDDLVSSLISNADESRIIAEKKTNSGSKASTSSTIEEPQGQ